jgi:beta-galactosidase
MNEFAHAMFNSMGALGEYNDQIDAQPALLGGAIWEFQDQGLWNRRDPQHPILAYGGGFGDFPNDKYFIHKGVVAFDRSPKPHYQEMKRVFQWIGVEQAKAGPATLTIRNKYQFVNLSRLDAAWTLCEDGRPIQSGQLQLPVLAPLSEVTIPMPGRVEAPKPGAEYFLNLSFTMKQDDRWAKKGFEVAAAQFKLPVSRPAAFADPAAMKPVELKQDGQTATVAGDGFKVVFDKASGTMSRLERDGVNLLAPDGGPRLHLWRTPHRNDDVWAFETWSKHGLDKLKTTVTEFQAEQTAPATVRVSATLLLEGKQGFAATHAVACTVFGDGSIAVDNAVSFAGPRIALARLGVRMLLDKQLDHFDFFGRGPMENYADRKRGADAGLYGVEVSRQYEYEKPMECGNHEDVRWAALTGAGMPGLFAQADGALLQAAALPHTDEQMLPVEYRIDLPQVSATAFILAAKTLGVGSASCGPQPADSCRVMSDPAAFSYILRLLPKETKPSAGFDRTQLPARPPPKAAKPAAGPAKPTAPAKEFKGANE